LRATFCILISFYDDNIVDVYRKDRKSSFNSYIEVNVVFLFPHDRLPDCTGAHGFTDVQFRDAFCSGLIGERENSLDLQCQRVTGWSLSTACTVSF